MFGLKRPTRIDLRANDAAIVVRENGEMEMFIRQAKSDEELPSSQVVLALFGMTFHDERVRKLLTQIVKEKESLT
ncbi:hypothetical protein ACVIW2_000412 [Bradyrhizobium huanghuaihaiense]